MGNTESTKGFIATAAIFSAIATGIFSLWCTVIAFTGGRLPILGWRLEGGFFTGMLWLVFIAPILVSVVHFGITIILSPLSAILAVDERRELMFQRSKDNEWDDDSDHDSEDDSCEDDDEDYEDYEDDDDVTRFVTRYLLANGSGLAQDAEKYYAKLRTEPEKVMTYIETLLGSLALEIPESRNSRFRMGLRALLERLEQDAGASDGGD